MRTRTIAMLSAALCAGAVVSALPARARPAPPAEEPKPIPKIENAFLDGFVGSWDVAFEGMGSTGSGVSKVSKAAGGTTLLQETQVTVMGRNFYAVTVTRVDETGKGARLWRFDTSSGVDMTAFKGTLGEGGIEAKSESGVSVSFKKKGAAYETTIAKGAETVFTSTYTKAAKDVVLETPNAPKDGILPAMIGTWDATGEWVMAVEPIKVAGTSTFRWALGGSMILHDYDRTSSKGPNRALGAWRWPTAGSAKSWWFETGQLDPMPAEGALTDTAWHGKGTFPDGAVIGLEWTKKGEGFEMRYEMGGQTAGHETYTKKK